MGPQTRTGAKDRAAWALVDRQHGVVSAAQLVELGISRKSIAHRVAHGRLHQVRRGVYAVGRPALATEGRWMAAVLACGRHAATSHTTAAAVWGIVDGEPRPIHITVPRDSHRTQPGLTLHHRNLAPEETTTHNNLPLTQPALTLVDLAASFPPHLLEAAVNRADKLNRINPERLRREIAAMPRRHGVRALRRLLDAHTFRLTDSELERRFLRLVERAGIPLPQTGASISGFKTDFYWPQFGLVVETDGLTYHRTPAQQARDLRREQAHTAAGLTPLRFTHAQITRESRYVAAILRRAARPSPASRS